MLRQDDSSRSLNFIVWYNNAMLDLILKFSVYFQCDKNEKKNEMPTHKIGCIALFISALTSILFYGIRFKKKRNSVQWTVISPEIPWNCNTENRCEYIVGMSSVFICIDDHRIALNFLTVEKINFGSVWFGSIRMNSFGVFLFWLTQYYSIITCKMSILHWVHFDANECQIAVELSGFEFAII